jgi:putative methyltransferase
MKKNIMLVQVADNYGENKFLPLAIGYQWLHAIKDAKIKSTWNLVDVLIEKLDIVDFVKSIGQDLDLVAMSSYVWNWNFNNELAKEIKKRWPDCIIVMGGPEVNKHDPDLVRNRPWIDVAVLGENETAFQSFLIDLDVQRITNIPGVITKYTRQIIQPDRTKELTDIPSPILSGFYDDIIEKYKKTGTPVKYWQVTWESMRGCPYHCAFCDIGEDYWNKTYFFNLKRIKKEIEWMGQNKIEYVSVCDSNWGMFEHDVQITQWVIDTKLKYGYPRFWDVTWAKNNTARVQKIALMDHSAGTKLFKGITFAFQSFNTDTLKAVKRFNLQDAAVRSSLQLYKDHNIATYSELIWPMPNETVQSLKNNLQYLVDIGQRDFVMVHPLVLTPNSGMGQKEYIQHHGLKSKNVCLDTFWLKINNSELYIKEKVDAVYETHNASYQDVIDGNMFSYWLIVLYYYGWAHAIIEYLVKTKNKKHIDVIDDFIKWVISQPSGIMINEHTATKNGFCDVFESDGIWGRQLKSDDVYWEYKSATSVQFHQNRLEVKLQLKKWLHDSYNIDSPELLEINEHLCYDWHRKYPYTKSFPLDIIERCTGIKSRVLKFDHWDSSISSDEEFCNVAYHYQRKNRYWRCLVTPVE